VKIQSVFSYFLKIYEMSFNLWDKKQFWQNLSWNSYPSFDLISKNMFSYLSENITSNGSSYRATLWCIWRIWATGSSLYRNTSNPGYLSVFWTIISNISFSC
jgi:hypothetical protein